ncbi:hypothetical protein KAM644c_33290 [Klebsiella quasipneumoniae subsp. quasipneumoniae]|uniref:Uncharacterized protein n=1 Tax=Klebsiella quasipneumoniae subsp. quasipneumoniae TaxID=1667327 RepID=A0AAN1Y6C7_9ENTR|nr:hypothetical protein KAM622c_34300 [Klebsiella quasipneumoniae subsp. quasipneumoniae]BDO14263.1 hypothetical protein KAM644c_33290 [Klebsiella quasipneumoniae subsp. quasipneumoniae]
MGNPDLVQLPAFPCLGGPPVGSPRPGKRSIDYLPGNPVAPLFCRVAAAPDPAYGVLSQAHTS